MISVAAPGILFERYRLLAFMAFMIVLGGTFCFGRAFSVQECFRFYGIPFYITDVFLLFALPLACEGLLSLRKISGAFYWSFCIFLGMGLCYLLFGVFIDHSGFALRGVVLSSYLLFVPFVWRMRNLSKRQDIFFLALILCNMISIMVGSGVAGAFSGQWAWLQEISSHGKGFNFALYEVIACAFLLAYGIDRANNLGRILGGALVGINLYFIMIGGVRSAWVAIVFLMVFFLGLLWRRLRQMLIIYVTALLVVMGLVYFNNFHVMGRNATFAAVERMKGGQDFLMVMTQKTSQEQQHQANIEQPERSVAYNNILWRLQVWKATWDESKRSWLWGHGFSDVLIYDESLVMTAVHGYAKDSGVVPPHNEFLTIFYKMGLIGLGLFLWINGLVIVQGIRTICIHPAGFRRVYLIGAVGSLVAWHVMAQFFDLIDSPPTNIFLWMLLGLVLTLTYGPETGVKTEDLA